LLILTGLAFFVAILTLLFMKKLKDLPDK